MPALDEAIDDLLSQKRIAVEGVSREAGGAHASNGIYTRFKERGYEVFAVNPNADRVMGDVCYRSLSAIPGGVDGVVIATHPSASKSVAAECESLGISRVWFHKNIGLTSYSEEAHDFCRANGITALVSCPSGTANGRRVPPLLRVRLPPPRPGPEGPVAAGHALAAPERPASAGLR